MKPAIVILSLGLATAVHAATVGPAAGFNRLLDAVARIDVREVAFDGGARRFAASIGSGVILSDDGLILTNAHVVSPRAVEVSVTLASLERVGARLIGWDHWTDLAVLRLDMADVRRRGLHFQHGEFGDSARLYPGETVFAVGTPYGLTRTVTKGIISNTDRYFESEDGVDGYETGNFSTWLQTDAAINPGNSGGPLVTEDGRVIGITSRAYLGANNLGFAIPARTAQHVMAELISHGAVARSYIGIVPRALRDLESFYSLALNRGVLVDSLDAGSPAARAGVRVGDVILAIDGHPVDGRFPEQLPPLQAEIARRPVGSSLQLTLKSGTQVRAVAVVTEPLESAMGEEQSLDRWGVTVRKISRGFARQHQLESDRGAIVLGVEAGFPAEIAGLQAGDIIMRVNRAPVGTLAALQEAQRAFAAHPAPVLIEAQRDRQAEICILKP